MKIILAIISLICFASAQPAVTGQYIFQKKVSRGYEPVYLTPENGKVIGWTAGNLANVVGGGGGGTWASLTDKATAPLPTDNTALSAALASKAPLTNPNFAGNVITSYGSIITSSPGGNVTLTHNGVITASGNISGANLSGTNTGNQTSIVGITGTKAQFDTAATDGNFGWLDGLNTWTQNQTFNGSSATFNSVATFTDDAVVNGSLTSNYFKTIGSVDFQAGSTFTYGTGIAAIHRTALSLVPGTNIVAFNGALGTPTSGDFSTGTFTWPTFNQSTTGNSATVTSIGNLTGVVTSANRATSIANGAITNAMLANSSVANLSGTNTGDNSPNSTYAADYRAANFVAGTNYIAPNGSAALLTLFPTLNQNTTGTAAGLSAVNTGALGGTGVANTGKTITLSGNLTTTGAFNTTFVQQAAVNVTLPNAASTLPVFSQQATFTGPTAARSYVLPDRASTLMAADDAIFNYAVASGTDGASLTGSTWTKAPLNTTLADPSGAFTLSGNVLTVTAAGAGRWTVRSTVILQDYGNSLSAAKSRLRRTNNTATTLAASTSHFYMSFFPCTPIIASSVLLTAGDTLELQGWANSTTPNFGKAASSGESEIYASIAFSRQ